MFATGSPTIGPARRSRVVMVVAWPKLNSRVRRNFPIRRITNFIRVSVGSPISSPKNAPRTRFSSLDMNFELFALLGFTSFRKKFFPEKVLLLTKFFYFHSRVTGRALPCTLYESDTHPTSFHNKYALISCTMTIHRNYRHKKTKFIITQQHKLQSATEESLTSSVLSLESSLLDSNICGSSAALQKAHSQTKRFHIKDHRTRIIRFDVRISGHSSHRSPFPHVARASSRRRSRPARNASAVSGS